MKSTKTIKKKFSKQTILLKLSNNHQIKLKPKEQHKENHFKPNKAAGINASNSQTAIGNQM